MSDRRKSPRGVLRGLIVVALVLIGVWAGWSLRGPATADEVPETTTEVAEAQTWTCSMHPQIQRDGPGSCPLCGMDLIPVEVGSGGGLRTLTVTPAARELMRIRTHPVERRFVETEVRMVGMVAHDETRRATVTAWVPGRLERLFVDYTGVSVRAGDHMVELYSPDLLATQEVLLQAKRTLNELESSELAIIRESAEGTLHAVREKLRLWGLTPGQIEEIEERGTASDRVTIFAPIGGIVTRMNAEKGSYVQTGTPIFTIDDLTHVWVKLEAYESDLAWLHYGQAVVFTTEAHPGQRFVGKIAFIDPVLDSRTRTVKVRVNVANDDGLLKPNMFVRALVRAKVATQGKVMAPELADKWMCPMHPEVVKDTEADCDLCGMDLVRTDTLGFVSAEGGDMPLVIPRSAALVTGTRAVVYVEVEGEDADAPTYEGRQVVLGVRAGEFYVVKSGLEEGELVVIQGNFKLDSALQIQARPSMMTPIGGGGGGSGHEHDRPSSGGHEGHEMDGAASDHDLPAWTLTQIERVRVEHARIHSALKADNMESVRAAYVALGEAVEGVDGDSFEGDARAIWNEAAMRLRNDSVEGRDASDLPTARRVLAGLGETLAWLAGELDLGPEPDIPAPHHADPASNARVREGLTRLWPLYCELHEALAADDVERSRTAASANVELLGDLGEAAVEAGSGLKTAETLEDLRVAFEPLSDWLTVALEQQPDWTTPVLRVHCPMAFDGDGGSWLQADEGVRNPYYGSEMFRCGRVVDTLHDARQEEGGHDGH